MLPKEFKEKWVTALRSSNYKQGRGELYNCNENAYCCLGVAAHVCGVPLEKEQYRRGVLPDTITQGVYQQNWNIPAELTDDVELQMIFWKMNDTKRKTFGEIADYIEQNL